MVCIIYECISCFYSLFNIVKAVQYSSAHTYHIYTTYLPCLVSVLSLFVLSSVDAFQESCLGTVVNMSTPLLQMFLQNLYN